MIGNNTEMTKQSLEFERVIKIHLGKVFNKVEKRPLQTAQKMGGGGSRFKPAHTLQGARFCEHTGMGVGGPNQERPPVLVKH